VPVQIGAPAGNDIVLTGGVASGQTVVTAGVNSLKQGQKVSILGEELSAPKVAEKIADSSGTQTAAVRMPNLIREANAGAVAGGAVK